MGVRARGDDGFVGGFAGLLFGLLLFVAGTLLVAFAWGIVDTKSALVDAARRAGRTYVQSPDPVVAARDATLAAADTLAGYGRDPSRGRVRFESEGWGRCDRVTVVVSYPSPLLYLPFVGRVGTGQSVQADHSELVDPYRSGLPGAAACA